MTQTKFMSFVEALVNTAIGLVIAYFATAIIVWAYDMPLTSTHMFHMVFWMTVLSVVRGYVVRRFFNKGFLNRYKFKMTLGKIHPWIYGTCEGLTARRHKYSGAVQYALPKNQFDKSEQWVEFHHSWWNKFVPSMDQND